MYGGAVHDIYYRKLLKDGFWPVMVREWHKRRFSKKLTDKKRNLAYWSSTRDLSDLAWWYGHLNHTGNKMRKNWRDFFYDYRSWVAFVSTTWILRCYRKYFEESRSTCSGNVHVMYIIYNRILKYILISSSVAAYVRYLEVGKMMIIQEGVLFGFWIRPETH